MADNKVTDNVGLLYQALKQDTAYSDLLPPDESSFREGLKDSTISKTLHSALRQDTAYSSFIPEDFNIFMAGVQPAPSAPSTPIKPSGSADYSFVEKKMREAMATNPIYDSPKTRQVYYDVLTKKGYDAEWLKNIGEETVSAKGDLQKYGQIVNSGQDKNGEAQYGLARAQGILGDYESAISNYSAVLAKNPKNGNALYGLGTIYEKMGKPDEAKKIYQEAMQAGFDPNSAYLPESQHGTDPNSAYSQERKQQQGELNTIAESIGSLTPLVSSAKGMIEGLDASMKTRSEHDAAVKEWDQKYGVISKLSGVPNIGGILNDLHAGMQGGLGLAMGTPVGLLFSEGTNAAKLFTPEEVMKNVLSPVQSAVERSTNGDPSLLQKNLAGLADVVVQGVLMHEVASGGKGTRGVLESISKMGKGEPITGQQAWEFSQAVKETNWNDINKQIIDHTEPDPKIAKLKKVQNDLQVELQNKNLPDEAKAVIADEHQKVSDKLYTKLNEVTDADHAEASHEAGTSSLIDTRDQRMQDLQAATTEEGKKIIQKQINDLNKEIGVPEVAPIEPSTPEPVAESVPAQTPEVSTPEPKKKINLPATDHHQVYYNGKVVDMSYVKNKKDQFKFASQRVADNLGTGGHTEETGIVRTPDNKFYEVSKGNKKAKLLTGDALEAAKEKFAVKESKPEAPAKKEFDYTPGKNLSESDTQVETNFAKSINDNEAEMQRIYREGDKSLPENEYLHNGFGNVINTDNARELSPEYRANRNLLSTAVHEPASSFIKRLYTKMLSEPLKEGQAPNVVFTGGGTGAGKTTGMNNFSEIKNIVSRAQIVYDTNMNGTKSAMAKIEEAKAAGKNVPIYYTFRDPVDAFLNGAVPRAKRVGRTVPVSEHARTHVESFKTIFELAEHYKNDPQVHINIIDNSRGKGKTAIISLDELKQKPYIAEKDLINILHEQNDNLLEQGKLTESEHAGFRGRKTNDGSGDGQRVEGNAIQAASENLRELDGGKSEQSGVARQESVKSNLTDYEKDRERGFKTVNGERVVRQAPITFKVEGKEINIHFGKKNKVPGQWTVIERENLQPSHKSGLINEKHFIPEAQPRDRAAMDVLKDAAKEKADNLEPELLGQAATAYDGAPIVNERGEVIQGNGRAEAIDYYYRNTKDDPRDYRPMIEELAPSLDLDAEKIAVMKEPVLVRMVKTDDAKSIELGNMKQSELEDVNQAGSSEKALVNKMKSADVDSIADLLLSRDTGNETLKDLIRQSGKQLITKLMERGILRKDAMETYFTNGLINPSGIDMLHNVFKGLLFKGGHINLETKFNSLPDVLQKGIEKAAVAILRVPEEKSIRDELQIAISNLHDLKIMRAEAEMKVPFDTFLKQGDVFSAPPIEKLTDFEIALSRKLDEAKTQSEVAKIFTTYADLVTDKPADMFDEARPGLSKEEAVKKQFNVSYESRPESYDAETSAEGNRPTDQASSPENNTPVTERKNASGVEETTDSGSTADATTRGDRSATDNTGKEALDEVEELHTNDIGVLGAPFAKEFIENDITPILKEIGISMKEMYTGFKKLFVPVAGVPREGLQGIMGAVGEKAKQIDRLHAVLDSYEKEFDKMKEADRITFIDNIKRGKKQSSPELQDIANLIRDIDDELFRSIQKYRPNAAWIENHFRVLWKNKKGFDPVSMGSRPLQGSRGFMKRHTLEDMSEGIAKGLTPTSTNPITIFKLAHADVTKFVSAQEMWKRLGDAQLRKFVPLGGDVPDGYVRLNDRIADAYFPVETIKGEAIKVNGKDLYEKGSTIAVKRGEWYVEKNCARLLNNYLSRDLIRETSTGKGLLNVKNITTMFELSFSGFHFTGVTLESMAAQNGVGIRNVWNGIFKGDLKLVGSGTMDIATTPLAPMRQYMLGRKFENFISKKDFINTAGGQKFLANFPNAAQMVEEFYNAGGVLHSNKDLQGQIFKGLMDQKSKGNYVGVMLRALPALSEAIMSPLFNNYIPRMKLGAWMRDYSALLKEHENDLASGKIDRVTLGKRAWDFVEDRLGEMNYESLFWNKTFKTTLQLFFRSVTWKMGTIRGMGGGVVNMPLQVLEFANAVKEGRTPRIDPKLAWLIGLSAITVATSAIIQKLYTGEDLKDLKDVIAPRIDKNDNEQRITSPTYAKDALHAYHSPLGFIGSSLSFPISKAIDLWKNQDFYGYHIRETDDPLLTQVKDVGIYVLPKPFSYTGAEKLAKQGEPMSTQVAQFFGLSKAPSYLKHNGIEGDIYDQFIIYNSRVKDKYDREGNEKKKEIYDLIDKGKTDEAVSVMQKAVDEGLIRPSQIPSMVKNMRHADDDDVVKMFTQLPYQVKVRDFKKMNDEEKRRFDPYGKLEAQILQAEEVGIKP